MLTRNQAEIYFKENCAKYLELFLCGLGGSCIKQGFGWSLSDVGQEGGGENGRLHKGVYNGLFL